MPTSSSMAACARPAPRRPRASAGPPLRGARPAPDGAVDGPTPGRRPDSRRRRWRCPRLCARARGGRRAGAPGARRRHPRGARFHDRPPSARCRRAAGWRPGSSPRRWPSSQLALVAGGITAYEACALGVPVVAVSVVPAQQPTVRALARRGAAVNGGPLGATGAERRVAGQMAQLLAAPAASGAWRRPGGASSMAAVPRASPPPSAPWRSREAAVAETRAILFDLDDTLYPLARFVMSGFAAVAAPSNAGGRCRAPPRSRRSVSASAWPADANCRCSPTRHGLPADVVAQLVDVIRLHVPDLRLPDLSAGVLGGPARRLAPRRRHQRTARHPGAQGAGPGSAPLCRHGRLCVRTRQRRGQARAGTVSRSLPPTRCAGRAHRVRRRRPRL